MIYLDNQSTTPVDPRVLDAMRPFFELDYANPHSAEHAPGRAVAAAVEVARAEIASLLGAEPREIVFCSGATEANNLAIKGAARFARDWPDRDGIARRRIVTLATEHDCVLETVRDLAGEGFEPVVLPVPPSGLLDLASLEAALAVPTLLVSVMAANNETGVLQDLDAIGRLCREAGAKLHSDLAQAAGKVAVPLERLDLASLSAHKMHGPKGVGALFVRRRPRMRIAPLFSGGGQERGLRPGTLPAPLVVGFGAACRLARLEGHADGLRIAALRDRLLAILGDGIEGLAVNGDPDHRLPGNLNVALPRHDATALLARCPDIAVSTGSACNSAEIAPSRVLLAMGLGEARARRSLRAGLGRLTSAADIERAGAALVAGFHALDADAT